MSDPEVKTNGKLDKNSLEKLQGADSRLADVILEVSKRHDVIVTESKRTPERQKQLLAEGFTKTLNSRHLSGSAVDVYPADVIRNDRLKNPTAEDKKKWERFARDVIKTGKQKGIDIEWGGDWEDAWDMPHLQINN